MAKKMQVCAVMFLVMFLVNPAITGAEEPARYSPIALHPDNPHYFTWRGKPTVLVTSGEHYGALLNLDFDYETYFAALAKDGLNHTRIFAGTYREIPGSFGITENTLAPKPGKFISPWARSDTPGNADGGMKFDLSRYDEAYFARLKKVMRSASKHAVVVEFTFFCPLYDENLWKHSPMHAGNNVNGVGKHDLKEVHTLRHIEMVELQVALVKKLVRELQEFDNVFFEVCNEPYFGGVTMDWQEWIVEMIADTEKELPRKHLISMNIANGRAKIKKPHPAVSIFNFHYCVPPDVVAMNYGLNKAIGENETGFRGQSDELYRTEGWAFMLAGGTLYNNLDYSFSASHPGGTLKDYKSPGGGSPALRQQLGHLKKFLESIEFVKMKPDPACVKKVSPQLSVQALVQRGKQYAVYLHVPIPEKPKKLADHLQAGITATVSIDVPVGEWNVSWFDTKTGVATSPEKVTHESGALTVTSPKFDNDVALRIERAE